MEEVDNDNIAEDSDHDEMLDAAITYKKYGKYPSKDSYMQQVISCQSPNTIPPWHAWHLWFSHRAHSLH